jgi:hypothetical protein
MKKIHHEDRLRNGIQKIKMYQADVVFLFAIQYA